MLEKDVRPLLERAVGPVLEAAGFSRNADRWESRRGDAIRSVEIGTWWRSVLVRAGIGFGSVQEMLRRAPSHLDLSYNQVPASQLLQLRMHQAALDEPTFGGWVRGADWNYESLSPEALKASVVETFRIHILPFFESTSTIEEAQREVLNEGQFGDCGLMSHYEPVVNRFGAAALHVMQDYRWRAVKLMEKELEEGPTVEPWAIFRHWLEDLVP